MNEYYKAILNLKKIILLCKLGMIFCIGVIVCGVIHLILLGWAYFHYMM